MADWDTTDLRVESILADGFREAYGLLEAIQNEDDEEEPDE